MLQHAVVCCSPDWQSHVCKTRHYFTPYISMSLLGATRSLSRQVGPYFSQDSLRDLRKLGPEGAR